MNDDIKLHISKSLEKIEAIFIKAATRIEALHPGEKIPATTLAAELALEIGSTGAALYPTLLFLFKDYPGVDLKKGAHGGICKWKLPAGPVAIADAKASAVSDVENKITQE